MKKRRLLSILIIALIFISLVPTTAFAAMTTGTGISYTTNTNHWIRRGSSTGYQYTYKPPLVDGTWAYCVDYGYSYNSESGSFLNSYTWTRASGTEAEKLLERAVNISGMHEYSNEVLGNVKWLMSYVNQHYTLDQASLGEWLMCVQTYVWDNMSYKSYGDTSDGGQIDGGGYANPDTYEKYKRMYTDLLAIKAEEDAALQRQVEEYAAQGIDAYVAPDSDSQWAVYAVSNISGRQGFFNYNETRKVIVGDIPDEPDIPEDEPGIITIFKRDTVVEMILI